MPTIRTTQEPWREIVVTEAEYLSLLRAGLVYDEDGPPPPPPPSFTDAQYAELAHPEGEAVVRVVAAALDEIDETEFAALVSGNVIAAVTPSIETAQSTAEDAAAAALSAANAAGDASDAAAAAADAVASAAADAADALAAAGSASSVAAAAASDVDTIEGVLAGRLSDATLHGKYLVHRVWNGSAYPARVSGAVNIFIGPTNPGGAMSGDDYWATPDATTLDEVTTEAENTSTALYSAIQTTARPQFVEFSAADFNPIDNRPATLGTLSPSANMPGGVPVYLFADEAVQIVGRTWRTPVGWSACRVSIDWSHYSSGTGGVQWQARFHGGLIHDTDLTVTTGAQTLSQVQYPAGARVLRRLVIAGNFTLNPAGETARLTIARLNTSMGGAAGLIGVRLERTA